MLLSASTEVQTSAALQRAHSPHHSALLPQAAGRSARAPAGTAPVRPALPGSPPGARGCAGPPPRDAGGLPAAAPRERRVLLTDNLFRGRLLSLW